MFIEFGPVCENNVQEREMCESTGKTKERFNLVLKSILDNLASFFASVSLFFLAFNVCPRRRLLIYKDYTSSTRNRSAELNVKRGCSNAVGVTWSRNGQFRHAEVKTGL